jgi:hypothetical protein
MAWIPTVAGAGLTALGAYGASKKQASSATNAANIRAQSEDNAAKIRSQFDERQLEYLKGESLLARQQAEVNRKANFGTWDVTEQNLYNRTRDALMNSYAATTAQGLNEADRFNVGQGNIFDQWTTGRADKNLQLTQKDQRMSELGVMLGMDPRVPLNFRDDPTLRQYVHKPGARPTMADRETMKYVPGVTLPVPQTSDR